MEVVNYFQKRREKRKREQVYRSELRDKILRAGWRIEQYTRLMYRDRSGHPYGILRPDGKWILMLGHSEDEAYNLLVDKFLELGITEPADFDYAKDLWCMAK